MIVEMTSSQTGSGPATTDPDPAAPPAADDMITAAAAAWLTPGTVTVVGRHAVASIAGYRRGPAGTRRGPRHWPGSTRPC